MADRAVRIAHYLAEECQDMDRDAAVGAVIQRWPDVKADEIKRAFQIAGEMAQTHMVLA